jgi:geranylgeranyl reductase family protein
MNSHPFLTCDVLVIGAGPAGSTAARFAAQKGASVILLERRETVGQPVRCAEYVPLPVDRYLDLNRPGLKVQGVRAMETFIPGRPVKETTVPGLIINRDRFDQELADLALMAGSTLLTGCQAAQREDDQVVARGEKGLIRIRSRVIIGADGPSSQVRRWMGISQQPCLVAAQYRVLLKTPLDRTQIYFHPYIRGGYGWLFPKRDQANLGLGIEPSSNRQLMPLLKQFKEELVQKGLIEEKIVNQAGGLVPVGGLTLIHKENMILAGDAAGTCHPITGAGVGNALISGEIAGKAAAEAVRQGNLNPLQEYQKELTGLLGHSLNHGTEKRKRMMDHWDEADFSETIRRSWIAFKDYYR